MENNNQIKLTHVISVEYKTENNVMFYRVRNKDKTTEWGHYNNIFLIPDSINKLVFSPYYQEGMDWKIYTANESLMDACRNVLVK